MAYPRSAAVNRISSRAHARQRDRTAGGLYAASSYGVIAAGRRCLRSAVGLSGVCSLSNFRLARSRSLSLGAGGSRGIWRGLGVAPALVG
jgi:hypothetical protein